MTRVEVAEPLHRGTQLLRGEIRLHRRARRALQVLGPVADEHGRETAALRDVDDLLLRDARDDAQTVVRRRETHDGVERLLVRAALLVEHGEQMHGQRRRGLHDPLLVRIVLRGERPREQRLPFALRQRRRPSVTPAPP